MALSRRELWRRARKDFRTHPSFFTLRAFLIAKARMGWWDPRMCTLHGVSSDVTLPVRRWIVRGYANGLIPTSTRRQGQGSFHDLDPAQAADLGVMARLVGTTKQRRRLVRFQEKEFKAWRAGKRGRLVELIGPDNNMIVLRGRHAPLHEGHPLENMHDNHDHGAFN